LTELERAGFKATELMATKITQRGRANAETQPSVNAVLTNVTCGRQCKRDWRYVLILEATRIANQSVETSNSRLSQFVLNPSSHPTHRQLDTKGRPTMKT
jgi:hypothetical protein